MRLPNLCAIGHWPPASRARQRPDESIVRAAKGLGPGRDPSRPSEIFVRRIEEAKPPCKPGSVTAPVIARYDRHSSRPAVTDGLEPPTRGLGEQRRRPPIWRCSGWRLPRFTRSPLKGSDSSLWPCSSPLPKPRGFGWCGRALPGILLCGARTFLSPETTRGSDDPGGFARRL